MCYYNMASINTSDHNQLQDDCSIYDDLESLLSEVQCLQELKMTTTVTKGVLSNIEIITKLEGEKRKNPSSERQSMYMYVNLHCILV